MTVPAPVVNQNGIAQVSADNLNTYISGGCLVSTLRAFTGISGMEVGLVGYTSPGDGGQGFFYWNATGTSPDDNGVTTIVPSGASVGCWTRLTSSQSMTLANGDIYVGNASNVATAVTMSGDATISNTGALTLGTVNGSPGSYTLASITVDAKGRVTAAASGSGASGVTTTGSPVNGNLTKFSAPGTITNADLTGDVTTSGGVATTLATVNSNVGSFTNAAITVNAKGLVTAASSGSVPLMTALGVGSIIFGQTNSGTNVSAGSTTNFGNITPVAWSINGTSWVASGDTIAGVWRALQTTVGSTGSPQPNIILWQRIS